MFQTSVLKVGLFVIIFSLEFCCCAKLVAHEVLPDRPDYTDGIGIIPPEHYQLEGGFTFARNAGISENSYGEFLLRQGMGRDTELRLGISSYFWTHISGENISGWDDTSIGFKWHIRDESEKLGLNNPGMALEGTLNLPTGAQNIKLYGAEPEIRFLFSWNLNKKLALGSNICYGKIVDSDSRIGRFWRSDRLGGSLSMGYDFSPKISGFLEIFGFRSHWTENQGFVDTGFWYSITDDYGVDFRIGHGLNGLADDYFTGFGFGEIW
ncbi:MAG: transporter [Candidatus Riflebacteria bacterium]|nr:transporter [Candidatus Riflebacteria bacterium]